MNGSAGDSFRTILPAHRWLRSLVRRPSVNPMGRTDIPPGMQFESRVANYLRRWAARRGIECELQPVAPHRRNVLMRHRNPLSRRTLLLEVHQDTVPVEGMTIDPFAGTIRDGRLYGRGACDVKGGMAAMLGAIDRLHRDRPATAANVVLACTVDEEHGLLGVQHLVKSGLRADFAVCAEPTGLRIVDAHKGVVRWKLGVAGQACHSSKPEAGANAIYRAAKLLLAIERYAGQLRLRPADARLGTPTLSVGTIQGGVSVNTVPDFCAFEIDRRLLPGERIDEARRDLEDFLRSQSESGFPWQIEPANFACPALESRHSGEIRDRLGAAIDGVLGAHEVMAVPFGTDASTLAEAGIPTVVFGPGDIAQAHTRDEWIELAQIDRAIEILCRLATTDMVSV